MNYKLRLVKPAGPHFPDDLIDMTSACTKGKTRQVALRSGCGDHVRQFPQWRGSWNVIWIFLLQSAVHGRLWIVDSGGRLKFYRQ
jgi:hypothetical protein